MPHADRYRGLIKGGPEKLGQTPLPEGHVSRVVRVRGPAAAVEAFAALTAEERGALVVAMVR